MLHQTEEYTNKLKYEYKNEKFRNQRRHRDARWPRRIGLRAACRAANHDHRGHGPRHWQVLTGNVSETNVTVLSNLTPSWVDYNGTPAVCLGRSVASSCCYTCAE